MPQSRDEFRAEMEQFLLRAWEDIPEAAFPEERGYVYEFIDHYEFGLAYDLIVWLVQNKGLTLSSSAASSLDAAREKMGLDAT